MSPKAASKTKTDLELAFEHAYVTEHGRGPAPGVTSCDIIQKDSLQWAASEIGVLAALDFDDLDFDAQQAVIDAHRAYLSPRKGPQVKHQPTGKKVPVKDATDEDILVHYLRGAFDRKWNAKADIGTDIHTFGEALAKGDDILTYPQHDGYIDAWEKFNEDCAPEWIELERIVVHPNPLGRDDLEYGGRFDWWAILHKGSLTGLRLGDYKTGGHYIGPVAQQAAGYLNAAGMATYLPNGDLGPLSPLPTPEGACTLYLQPDGEYHLTDPFEHVTFEAATRAFFDLRSALNWSRSVESVEGKLKRKAAKA